MSDLPPTAWEFDHCLRDFIDPDEVLFWNTSGFLNGIDSAPIIINGIHMNGNYNGLTPDWQFPEAPFNADMDNIGLFSSKTNQSVDEEPQNIEREQLKVLQELREISEQQEKLIEEQKQLPKLPKRSTIGASIDTEIYHGAPVPKKKKIPPKKLKPLDVKVVGVLVDEAPTEDMVNWSDDDDTADTADMNESIDSAISSSESDYEQLLENEDEDFGEYIIDGPLGDNDDDEDYYKSLDEGYGDTSFVDNYDNYVRLNLHAERPGPAIEIPRIVNSNISRYDALELIVEQL